jgi:uncharacterized membrane protein YidH (DUF202 family)
MGQREEINGELTKALRWYKTALALTAGGLGWLSMLPRLSATSILPQGFGALLLLLVGFATMMYATAITTRVRCRACGERFGPAIWYGKKLRTAGLVGHSDVRLRYCPGCGKAID